MAGGFFGSLFKLIGSQDKGGTNRFEAKPFGPGSAGYDANAGQYGGTPGGLQATQERLAAGGAQADSRDAFQANYSVANRARSGQNAMAAQMAQRATGALPSIAQEQARLDAGRAVAAQSSASAGARGAGAMALAQQNAANNMANAQAQISNQAQVNAWQERAAAEQAAAGAYSNLRAGDQGQAQFQAGMQQANRNANDARAMGYEQLSGRANEAAIQGRLQQQGILSGSYNNAQTLNSGVSQQNANLRARRTDQAYEASGDMFDNILTGAAQVSDTRAKKAALLEQGRRQGAQQVIDGGEIDEPSGLGRAFGGAPSVSQMLDDRAAGSARGQDVMDPEAFQRQLNGQVMQDRADLDGERVANEAREASNRAEAAKIRANLAPSRAEMLGQGGQVSDASPMRGFFGMLGQPQAQAQPPSMSGSQRFLAALGGGGGAMVSDARAKREAFQEGVYYADALNAGRQTEAPEYVRGRGPGIARETQNVETSKSGFDGNRTQPRSVESGAPKVMERTMGIEGEGKLRQVPMDQSEIADANRSMVGSPYAYKDGIVPPGQAPGEVNVGPMAQNLERSPVAATAVKTDPRTGLKVIDQAKALKVAMSGIASLQQQQDQTRAMLDAGKPKKRGK